MLTKHDVGIFKTVITLTGRTFTLTRAAGDSSGWGYLKIKDFPAGRILVHGVVVDATMEEGLEQMVIPIAEGDFGLGTAAVDDTDALAGTEVDLCPSTACTFTGRSCSNAHGALAASAQFDGTSTAKDAYFNLRIDAGDMPTIDGEITLGGTVTITWSLLGDY